jgi:ribonucleoside-diphosphate reductase alpha chain
MEPLSKGGTASGPSRSCAAPTRGPGTIKSGGKTRRAAKMVVLDIDHPDIREFIWCKAKEEDKAAPCATPGFDMSIDGDGLHLDPVPERQQLVRVTDEFMHAVEQTRSGGTIARATGEPIGEPSCRPASSCGDRRGRVALRRPGRAVRHDDQPVAHVAELGRINASNPCSEYMHVDDSACNLASLNLMKFRRPDGSFDVRSFEHCVDVMLLAQEIIVGPSSYPTEEIGVNARAFRQLGWATRTSAPTSCRTACRTTPTRAAARPPRSRRS